MKITKNTTLENALKCPKAKEILAEYDVPCLFCPMARFEMSNISLEQISERYNINLKDLILRLNKDCK